MSLKILCWEGKKWEGREEERQNATEKMRTSPFPTLTQSPTRLLTHSFTHSYFNASSLGPRSLYVNHIRTSECSPYYWIFWAIYICNNIHWNTWTIIGTWKEVQSTGCLKARFWWAERARNLGQSVLVNPLSLMVVWKLRLIQKFFFNFYQMIIVISHIYRRWREYSYT